MNNEYYIRSDGSIWQGDMPADARLMTEEEVEAHLSKIRQAGDLQQYQDELTSTDWMIVRFSETGVEVPNEVKERRAWLREEISQLRGE